MKTGAIKGWEFTRFYAADGSVQQSTLDSLRSEKSKLEARILEIPKQMAGVKSGIARMQSDYDWLSSLSKSAQRSYEKEHGKHPHEVAHQIKQKIEAANATLTKLASEKSRLPEQIAVVQRQIDALVKGESEGLSKGLDKEAAQALGEIEVEKQQAQLEYEAKLQEIETQKAQRLAEEEIAGTNSNQSRTGLYIGIGVVVVLIIVGIAIYRSRMAKVKLQPMKV